MKQPKTVLVVDDSESIRHLLSHTLAAQGFKTHVAENGRDALRYFDQAEPLDLVITDLRMPEMDGISLIQEIRTRENYKFLPVLFLTTENQQAKKEQAKMAGATGWIVKPFETQTLLNVIKRVIR